MNIAVATLTRDRLAYTKHCFQTLRDYAGCEFDWWVVDQASEDGTVDWLHDQPDLNVVALADNIGICRALNLLIDEYLGTSHYDVLVRFDNDCEVVTPDTLRVVCETALEHGAIVAPRVLGLRNAPPVREQVQLGDQTLLTTSILGGIFMAVPTRVFREGFRYDERMPLWTGDEAVVPWWIRRGGRAGYLDGFEVNHYLTTDGQLADQPAYFARKDREYREAAA